MEIKYQILYLRLFRIDFITTMILFFFLNKSINEVKQIIRKSFWLYNWWFLDSLLVVCNTKLLMIFKYHVAVQCQRHFRLDDSLNKHIRHILRNLVSTSMYYKYFPIKITQVKEKNKREENEKKIKKLSFFKVEDFTRCTFVRLITLKNVLSP